MQTQVSFTTDIALKNKALAKAKQEGITLKALLMCAMKSFVEDKLSFGLQTKDIEQDVEELFISDPVLRKKAARISALLK